MYFLKQIKILLMLVYLLCRNDTMSLQCDYKCQEIKCEHKLTTFIYQRRHKLVRCEQIIQILLRSGCILIGKTLLRILKVLVGDIAL